MMKKRKNLKRKRKKKKNRKKRKQKSLSSLKSQLRSQEADLLSKYLLKRLQLQNHPSPVKLLHLPKAMRPVIPRKLQSQRMLWT
jgi:hypothetical protein